MNIAYIVPSLANKGPVIVVRDLCVGMIAAGHRCKVFYFDDVVEIEMPCEVERIAWGASFDFCRWDIVHSHMLRPDLWVWFHKPRFSRCVTRFLTTLHNPIAHRVSRLHRNTLLSKGVSVVWQWALRRFDCIVALNAHTMSTLPSYLRRKATVVFNGRDVVPKERAVSSIEDVARIEMLRSKGYRIIGSVGSIDRRKGIDQTIRALESLPHYAFVVVGTGEWIDQMRELAHRCGVEQRCFFTGYRPDAVAYYPYFDIFVMTSRSEGFPLALIEAAAHGLPCVLSDIPVFKAIVPEQPHMVVFYPLDDTQQLARSIEQADQDRDRLADAILSYYQQNLTIARMTDRYLNLYGRHTK